MSAPGRRSCSTVRGALVLTLLVCGIAAPSSLAGQDANEATHAGPAFDVALLINTGGLLLAPESYGGGIGLKVGREAQYLRLLVDVFLSTAGSGGSLALGATYERHFAPGAVSPYWGVGGFLGVASRKSLTDSQNWSSVTAVPFGASGLLGVELFLTQRISLFVEYALMVELAVIHGALTVDGTTSQSTYLDFRIDTGLGNQSKIGVAIYLPVRLRVPQRRARDRE